MVAMACEIGGCRGSTASGSVDHVGTRRRARCRQSPASRPVTNYLVGRYYDPLTGQFLSVDAKVQQTLEAYLYAGDDPVNGSDPNGMFNVGFSKCGQYLPGGPKKCGTSDPFGFFVSSLDSIGHWAYHNASTILSVISVIMYIACPETGGATCIVGQVFSYAAAGVDLATATRTCIGEGWSNSCRLAVANVGLDALTTKGGDLVLRDWKDAITADNLAKNAKLYMNRQKAVVNGVLNGLSAAASAAGNK